MWVDPGIRIAQKTRRALPAGAGIRTGCRVEVGSWLPSRHQSTSGAMTRKFKMASPYVLEIACSSGREAPGGGQPRAELSDQERRDSGR